MTRFLPALAVMIGLGAAAGAQTSPEPPSLAEPFQMPRDEDRAPGVEPELPGFLEGLFMDMFTRAQPHLEGLADEMSGLMEDYRPAFQEISRLIDDIGNYQMPPERLPNGDIIIRRKADAPPPPPIENLLPHPSPGPGPDGAPAPPFAAPGPQIEL